jgi:hypothetical protein
VDKPVVDALKKGAEAAGLTSHHEYARLLVLMTLDVVPTLHAMAENIQLIAAYLEAFRSEVQEAIAGKSEKGP